MSKIELLQYFGGDLNHANVARVSFAKEAENYTDEQNTKLINYLVKHGHCYDGQTEVLTSKGFINWKDVDSTTLLASVDPETRYFLSFEKPLDLVKKEIDENMLYFKTNDLDLMVTQGHSLFCSLSNSLEKRKNPKYELQVACLNIEDRSGIKPLYSKPMRMVKSAFNSKNGGNPELFKLYGFFIGDGHSTKESKNRIEFHLKKQRKIEYLKEIVKNLNLELRQLTNDTYSIVREGIGGEFKEFFYSGKNKTFPDKFYQMTSDEYEAFIDGLINSDGHFKRNVKVYDTNSEELANKIQALSSINGDSVAISTSNSIYRLNFSTRRVSPRLNDSDTNKYKLIPYKGYVYCATVSKGLLIVRRNGKVVLCGNTSPFRHSTLQFRIKCPIYVERQLHKHQVGVSVNSVSGRYVDFSDSYYQIPFGEWRKQSKSSKQGSEGFLNEEDQLKAFHIQEEIIVRCKNAYDDLLNLGVSKEQARSVLPLSLETEFIWTGTFLAFIHMCDLRLKEDTQKETRDVVRSMLYLVRNIEGNPFKYSLKAFGY